MVERHSFNGGQPSTLNINRTAAPFRNASLFYFGHESKGLNAEEIDSSPIPFTNNRIDMMFNAMINGNLRLFFAYVGSRFGVGREKILVRLTIKTVNDREPVS
jgi:hypothetical protein